MSSLVTVTRPLATISCVVAMFSIATPWPGPADVQLKEEEIIAAEGFLRSALAGSRERAFLQIMTDVSIVRDDSRDTTFVYDMVVRYDPERYRARHIGFYPVSFEDQFILWAKRVGLFTRGTTWSSGRFYLHDISTSRQAWIFAADARTLYGPEGLEFPAPTSSDNPTGVRRWLKLIHAAPKTTGLTSMARWLRLMGDEPRDVVLRRERSAMDSSAAASMAGK